MPVFQKLRLLAAVATLVVLSPLGAHAGMISELKIGVLAHDVPDLWSGFQLEAPAVDANIELLFQPLFATESFALKPAVGATINPNGDTSHVYADLRLELTPSPWWTLTLGIGAAYHDGLLDTSLPDRKALGSQLLFHPTAEVGFNLDAHNTVSVYFEHMSNAGTKADNEGIDDIGVRYGYRF
jgi:lipid A 3-O-deacylase